MHGFVWFNKQVCTIVLCLYAGDVWNVLIGIQNGLKHITQLDLIDYTAVTFDPIQRAKVNIKK